MSTKVKTSVDLYGEVGGKRDLVIQFNNLVAKFDALLAHLDADAGVSATDFVSTFDSNSTNGAQQIGNIAGTAISS